MPRARGRRGRFIPAARRCAKGTTRRISPSSIASATPSSNTTTLNFSYGVGLVADGTGVLLNNELDDFAAKPGAPNAFGLVGGEANAPGPGKRPLSSMTPTIVLKDGKPFLVTGSPGGSRIITAVLQVILNVIDRKLSIADAVARAAHPSSMVARRGHGRARIAARPDPRAARRAAIPWWSGLPPHLGQFDPGDAGGLVGAPTTAPAARWPRDIRLEPGGAGRAGRSEARATARRRLRRHSGARA